LFVACERLAKSIQEGGGKPSLEIDMNETFGDEKIVAFPAARIVARRGPADPDAAKFLGDVLPLMKAAIGIDYDADVRKTLHGPDRGFMEFIRDALDRGASPEEFVRFTLESNGLQLVGPNVTVDQAVEFNLVKMAIIDFADEQSDWTRGLNGSASSIVYASDGAVVACAMMNPILDEDSGEMGVAVRVYPRTFDNPDLDFITFSDTPSLELGGFDISEPVDELDAYKASFRNQVAYIR
jgi:hypothetical protein